jgi:hypothetical protein
VRRIRPLIFFVDNITSNMDQAKEFFRALIPLNPLGESGQHQRGPTKSFSG